jgi:YesN/AraC family two-component response regulator
MEGVTLNLLWELKYFARSLNLLIVEDEITLNEELSNILSNFFKEVKSAHNGLEALEEYKVYKPDIILTDISMPKMDGIKMSEEIKNINREQHIVVLSAHNDIKLLIKLIDIGIDQFVLKPLEKNKLMYALLKVSENITHKKEFNKFFRSKKNKELTDVVKERVKKDVVVNPEKLLTKVDLSKIPLSRDIKKANEFMKDIEGDDLLWISFKDDINELIQLSMDFSEDIERIILYELLTSEIQSNIVYILNSYSNVFSTLDQMTKMAGIMKSFAIFLNNLDVDSLTHKQHKCFKMLEFINLDLSRFVQTVFINKENIDIYYLEDSLSSSIKQLENEILGIVEEDEAEFF